MKVYMFNDYLGSIHGEPLSDKQSICDIDDIEYLPEGLVLIAGRVASVCSMNKRGGYITIKFVSDIINENEVSNSDEITCPHCGSEVHDSLECSDSDDSHTCETCNSVFSYERYVEVTYNSEIVDRNTNIQRLD